MQEEDLSLIAKLVSEQEGCQFSLLEIVYVDEDEILSINREHLEHDYITDIITFRYDEADSNQDIEGTLFCCAPRIYEQALELNQEPKKEFRRILIHGLLHLCGYNDTSPEEKREMSEREDFYLQRLA